jgi:hypothetical protein
MVRTILALISGFAIAHGITDQTWQLVSGCVLAIVPLVWTYFVHSLSGKTASAKTLPPVEKLEVADTLPDSAKLRMVEAMPDVKEIVARSTATNGVAAAVKDSTRPKVVSAPLGA